jgi:hypothetical protein
MKNKPCFPFLLILLSVALCGCGGLKPGTNGKAGKYFETFYAGAEGGTQYFIKPLAFVDEEKRSITVDFTLRDINFSEDSTTVNYTITTDTQLPDDQSIFAVNAAGELLFKTASVKRLFQERTKTGFLARYTALAPNTAVAKAFKTPELRLQSQLEDGQLLSFAPDNRAQGAIEIIYRNLFSLY